MHRLALLALALAGADDFDGSGSQSLRVCIRRFCMFAMHHGHVCSNARHLTRTSPWCTHTLAIFWTPKFKRRWARSIQKPEGLACSSLSRGSRRALSALRQLCEGNCWLCLSCAQRFACVESRYEGHPYACLISDVKITGLIVDADVSSHLIGAGHVEPRPSLGLKFCGRVVHAKSAWSALSRGFSQPKSCRSDSAQQIPDYSSHSHGVRPLRGAH